MKRFFSSCLLLLAMEARAQSKDETAIRRLLNDQTKEWNQGDIESFMKGYWQNDSLMFIGKNGIRYGWSNTLSNYKTSYPDTTAMGKLTFNIINLKQLSIQYFHVAGKWHLQRNLGDLSGYFTLLFKKIGANWVIISDHSS